MEFLTSDDVALEDGTCYVKEVGKEVPAVEIPYADRNGELLATRYRIAVGGDDKFRWETGSTTLYGLHKLEEAETAGTSCWSRVSLTVTRPGTEVSPRSVCPGWITGGTSGLSTSMASQDLRGGRAG